MIEAIYTWMKNMVFFLVIVTAVLEVLPGTTYQKYIRFFTGLVLMMLLLTPFLSLSGAGRFLRSCTTDTNMSSTSGTSRSRRNIFRTWTCWIFFRRNML